MENPSQRFRVAAVIHQNNLCFYCSWPMWNGADDSLPDFCDAFGVTTRQAKMLRCTAEHLKAVQDGGRDTRANIVAACEICNRRRHPAHRALSWEDYRAHVKRRVAARRWHPASDYKVNWRPLVPARAMPAISPHSTTPSSLRDKSGSAAVH